MDARFVRQLRILGQHMIATLDRGEEIPDETSAAGRSVGYRLESLAHAPSDAEFAADWTNPSILQQQSAS